MTKHPDCVRTSLFYGGRAARRYVLEPSRGVPFLSSSDMLLTDVGLVPRVSRVGTPGLDTLMLKAGWTLIARSGTVSVGYTAFVRAEMEGMAASEHVIRVVPMSEEVKDGFLFAYLSSKQGQQMLKNKIFGTIILHIDPADIAGIPVPIPPQVLQERIHQLVQGAADARTTASAHLSKVQDYFDSLQDTLRTRHDHALAYGTVRRRELAGRLDAFYHVGWATEAKGQGGEPIRDLGNIVATNRVPRVFAESGVPFLSGVDIFRARPPIRSRIARHVAERFDALVRRDELAVQGSGQRYGLLGRAAHVGALLDGWAASHDRFRVRAKDERTMARIYTYLRSESGHRAMLRHSYGTSIPHVNPEGVANVVVPHLPAELEETALRGLRLREQADVDEDRAIREVEAWLS